jgi:hypothetical protein
MEHDYIPKRDSTFLEWSKQLIAYVNLHFWDWKIPESTFRPLQEMFTAFETAYAQAERPNRGTVDVLKKIRPFR